MLLGGFIVPARSGAHLLSRSSHLGWHSIQLRLEIEFALGRVEFLLDEISPGEGWHVALVELTADGVATGASTAGRGVVHKVRVGELVKLGVWRSLRIWLGPTQEAHTHGVFVLMLLGHVLEGLCRRSQFRYGPVLGVPIGTPLGTETIVESIGELLRYGAAPLDAHIVQHSGAGVFLLDARLLLHLDLLLLLLGVKHLLLGWLRWLLLLLRRMWWRRL